MCSNDMETSNTIKAQIESTTDIAQNLLDETKNQTDLNEIQKSKIDAIISGIDFNDDLLYRVNCLQLISELVKSKLIFSYIKSKKIPGKVLSLLDSKDDLVIPHALKLFERMNPFDVEIEYPQVFSKVCSYFKSDDTRTLDYAIDFVATVGHGGYLSRKVLERHSEFTRFCLPKLGNLLISSSPLLKSRTLICIKDLVELTPGDPKSETMNLSKTFYDQIMPGQKDKMTKQLVLLCQMPIPEIRNNALDLAKCLAIQSWAPTELKEINANVTNFQIHSL